MKISQLIKESENQSADIFAKIDATALANQKKVLDAFRTHKVALRHFAPTSGYGYDDVGRDTLNLIYADVLHAEKAVVSPLLTSGTQALTVALFAVLRPGDVLLSVTGEPYDTLHNVISGNGIGSLKDFGISFSSVELRDGVIDCAAMLNAVSQLKPKMVFIQRSRGYNWRDALSLSEIKKAADALRSSGHDCVIMVDNCYGEFVDTEEPCAGGADLKPGSLI